MHVAPATLNVLVSLVCDRAPVVTGSGVVGTPLRTDATGDVTWMRGATVVGTGAAYTVQPADVGQPLRARIAYDRGDFVPDPERGEPVSFEPYAASTAPLTATAGPAAAGWVTVRGTPVPGQHLEASVVWGDERATSSYQWLRDGIPVAGADGATYTVTAADAGHDLAVRATATRAGYATATATSPAVHAALVTSGTSATLRRPRIMRDQKARIVVTVTAAGATPAGTVVVLDRGRVVHSATLTGARRLVLAVPHLRPGRRVLTVRYQGSDTTAASEATVVVTVVKGRAGGGRGGRG
jgi:hypothetical protein